MSLRPSAVLVFRMKSGALEPMARGMGGGVERSLDCRAHRPVTRVNERNRTSCAPAANRFSEKKPRFYFRSSNHKMNWRHDSLICHSERSEESTWGLLTGSLWILRFAQNDRHRLPTFTLTLS